MKIKTQFINSVVIFGIILLIIAISVIVSNQQVERLNTQEEIAKNIERGVSELGYLSNDYLLYHESPQRARWESKFSEISDYLSNLNPNSPEQQTLVNNIKSNQQRLKAVFTDVESTFENTSQQGTDPALFQISWNRMAVQNQGMAFDASRLSQMLHDQADQMKQTNITLIFALLGIFIAYFLTNYLIFYRRALKSISDLQAGTRIIGSGNLDYFIETNKQDEIGELSRAFNQMTADLKGVTASKAELEKEITERKRAEEALQESEQRWATTLASIGDAVIATDIEGRVTFMNLVSEALTGWKLTDALTKPVTEVFNIINEHTRREADNPVTKVLREGMIVGLANHTILVRKDGTEVPIDDSGAPIKDWGGKTMGVVLVFRDITERKRAEEALARSSRRVSEILESITDGFMAIDNGWRFTYANQRAAGNLGLKPEDLIGHNIWEKFPAIKGTDHEIYYHKAMQQREPQYFEIRGVLTDKWYEIRVYPSTEGISVFWQDTTERKRAGEALRKSNQQLDVLSYTASKLLTSDKPQQVVEELCQKVLSTLDCHVFFNYLVDEDKQCLHLNACAGIPEETAREIEWLDNGVAVCGCAARDGSRIVCENIPDTPDPRTDLVRYFGVKAYACHPLFSHGNVIGTLSFGTRSRLSFTDDELTLMKTVSEHVAIAMERERAHDVLERLVKERTAELEEANKALRSEIEERKQAEEKIREQAALLDKAHDAIAVRDLEHRLIYWNKGAQRLYGWTAEESTGKNADDLLYKEESPTLIEAKKSVIEKGEWMGELRQRTKDSKDITVEGRWTLVRDKNGKPKSILIINTDITEKKRLESQLLRAQRMESIGTLAGGIAHDLNNMLTPIMLSLQMLKEKFKDEKSQKLITILEQNSQRGAGLIKQVLSFARGVEGERKPLEIMHIISEIEKIAKNTFPRNIEIQTDMKKDLYTISGDATQLHQVIMNLCVNARDAMPDGGILSLSAENFFIDENYARMHTEAKIGSYVTIAVSDTGIGIPSEILDRIFDPFFTTKEFGKGTGLGLSTALAIVKSHGGFINVYSEVGAGTTFGVYLPAVKTEMQNVEEQRLELPTGHGELVLVAEDEDSVREVTISTLEKYGYNVLAAGDGAQAVAEYAQNKDKIKVILMDVMMPVMDGRVSIRAIRKINPKVRIIAVSGLAEKDELESMADYTNAFLPKPYTAERLLGTIHKVINSK